MTKRISIESKSYEGRVMMEAIDHSSNRDRNMRKNKKGGL